MSTILRKYIRQILLSELDNARVPNQLISKDKSHKKDDDDNSKDEASLKDACWKGYTAYGMKKKGNRMVPNCVPNENEISEIDEDTNEDAVVEFSSVGGGAVAGNVTGNVTGNIAGYTLPLGMSPGGVSSKKKKNKNRKRTYI